MTRYLINHLRIPGGVPKKESLRYLEQVEATTGYAQQIRAAIAGA
jgi:hypothetical protein